jgi:hypothetical protein
VSANIYEFQRKAQKGELDKIARETLYSLATQFKDLLKDDTSIDISDVYSTLSEALQQLFKKAIAVGDSTSMLGKTNYGCPHFEALKSIPERAPIPDECLICPKLMECFNKRTEV